MGSTGLPKRGRRSAERRAFNSWPRHACSGSAGERRPRNAFRRSTAASCVLGTVLPGTGASELRSPSRGISPRSPVPRPASLWQPLIVAADGDPRPPGGAKQRLLRARRRRIPPRANRRPGNAPQWGGMNRTIREDRNIVKEFIPWKSRRQPFSVQPRSQSTYVLRME